MKKKMLFIIAILIIVIIALITTGKKPATGNFDYLTVGRSQLMVEIANTPAQVEKGLSGRKKLCHNCGLLFIFPEKQRYTFWMKQMYFDIDIMWIDGDKVVDITYGAKKPDLVDFNQPKDVYSPKTPVGRVLEVNAGWVKQNGIVIGDLVKGNAIMN